MLGKFAAVLGPSLVGVFAQATGDRSIGVLSIAVLFVVGGGLLLRVPRQPEAVGEGPRSL
jgi:UMF1 family MFS transporter